MGGLIKGSLNALKNPTDFKGHATGGYSTMKKDEKKREEKDAAASKAQWDAYYAKTTPSASSLLTEEEKDPYRKRASSYLYSEGSELI